MIPFLFPFSRGLLFPLVALDKKIATLVTGNSLDDICGIDTILSLEVEDLEVSGRTLLCSLWLDWWLAMVNISACSGSVTYQTMMCSFLITEGQAFSFCGSPMSYDLGKHCPKKRKCYTYPYYERHLSRGQSYASQ